MRKIFTNESIRAIDKATLQQDNIPSSKLMERAAKAFVEVFCRMYSDNNKITLVCGPGNNGGDGLTIARLLFEQHYPTQVIYCASDSYSEDFNLQMERLKKHNIPHFEYVEMDTYTQSMLQNSDVIVDAIFGSGLNRIPSGHYAELISGINESNIPVVSVDVPSGIGEHFLPSSLYSIKASKTITFQLTKLCLLLEENVPFVGKLHTASIGLSERAIEEEQSFMYAIEMKDAKHLLRAKKPYYNKWQNGHSIIVAGSESKGGAALLAAESCLHGGCGMLSAIIPGCLRVAMNTRLPEVMIHSDLHQHCITHLPILPYADAYGIGCGIGTNELTQQALFQFLLQSNKPLVLDADALNILASHSEHILPRSCILTPHFKEFDRLTHPHLSHIERLKTLKEFCVKYQCTVVLKATHSCVCDKEGHLHFCVYPNASLGKAGTGDVLTGIITSLLAQGYDEMSACIIALHLIMSAGKLVSKKYTSYVSSATLLISTLPKAFKKLLRSK